MTICPCCGFKFEGDLRDGCESCGARAVGSPLPRPERELPAYGRTLLLVVTGTLVSLGFLVQTIIAFAERTPLSFGFWSWMAAGETAAWRIKWIAIPVMFVLSVGAASIADVANSGTVCDWLARRGLLVQRSWPCCL